MFSRIILAILISYTMFFIGCTGAIRNTTTARSATEILLVSTAAERAVQNYDVTAELKGKKISIDDSRYDAVDKKYVISALRNHLSANSIIISDAAGADYIMELRSGTLGIYNNDFTIGVPSVPVILGAFGTSAPPILTPDFPLLKRISAQGWCKLQIWLYDTKTKQHILTSPDLWGKCYYNQWTVIGIGPFDTSNDIYPEID